jgi:hypothetical protein
MDLLEFRHWIPNAGLSGSLARGKIDEPESNRRAQGLLFRVTAWGRRWDSGSAGNKNWDPPRIIAIDGLLPIQVSSQFLSH